MANDSVIKTRITPYFTLEIDKEDGNPPVKWRLCYTYKAIAKIEEATGIDLKKVDQWQRISSGKHFPLIVWGGLERFNPEVTLDEVIAVLNPEAQIELSNQIFDLLFPGAKEAYERELKRLADEKATGATASPNAETETPKV